MNVVSMTTRRMELIGCSVPFSLSLFLFAGVRGRELLGHGGGSRSQGKGAWFQEDELEPGP